MFCESAASLTKRGDHFWRKSVNDSSALIQGPRLNSARVTAVRKIAWPEFCPAPHPSAEFRSVVSPHTPVEFFFEKNFWELSAFTL